MMRQSGCFAPLDVPRSILIQSESKDGQV